MRKWAEEKIGKEYMPEIYGIYDRPEDIPFEILPNKFRIKCTHGRSMMILIRDKSKKEEYSWDIVMRRLRKNMDSNYAYKASMELWYEHVIPRLLVELPVDGRDYLDAIKVICQNGRAQYFVLDKNNNVWDIKKRNIYDRYWTLLDIRMKYPNIRETVEKPKYFDDMIRISERLSAELDFAVVHFWETPSKLIFNKICFEIGGGVEPISVIKQDCKGTGDAVISNFTIIQ